MKTAKTFLSLALSLLLTLGMLSVGVGASDVTVTSVVAEDMTVYFESDGQWLSTTDENGNRVGYAWFRYESEPLCTVTYSDGSFETVEFYDLFQLVGQYPSVETDQSIDNEWGLGDHTASFVCGDFIGEFTVTVLESPIASVEVQDTTIYQYVNGSFNSNGYFTYFFDPTLTVTYKDGTVITGTRAQIAAQSGYQVYWSSDQDTEWEIGDHTARAIFMGVKTDFTVTVEDIVTRIELIQSPTQTTLPYGAYFDLSGGVLRVHFADGRYEDVTLDAQPDNRTYTVETLDRTSSLKLNLPRATVIGDQDITLHFLGETASYTATVLPAPDNVTLTANSDHSLTLSYEYDDQCLELDVSAFSSSGGSWGTDGKYQSNGTLYTTGGMFQASLFKDKTTSEMWIALGSEYKDGGVYATTNTVTDTRWFDEHNGLYTYGDFDNDGETDTADVRGLLSALASYTGFDYMQTVACEVSGNGTLDTSDARIILKYVLG